MLRRSEAGKRRKEQHYEGRRQQNPRNEDHSRYLKDREQEGEHHKERQDSCAGWADHTGLCKPGENAKGFGAFCLLKAIEISKDFTEGGR